MPAYEVTMLVPIRLLVKADNVLNAEANARGFVNTNFGQLVPYGYTVTLVETNEIKKEKVG